MVLTKNNVIPHRIADALRKFPPFSMFSEEDVLHLAEKASVLVMAAGERLRSEGDPPGDELVFLARGRLEYRWQDGERSDLLAVRDVGDAIGELGVSVHKRIPSSSSRE